MAPGLIRDKVADRFATLNPSIRITQLSGQDLRDQIGRTILREAHGLYTQWQQQDSERVLRKSADTLEVILAGLKLQGLTEADLLQAREDRLNMFGAFDQGSFLQGAGREPGPWMVDDIPAFFMAPDHADRLIYLIRSELERSDRAWIASAFYSPGVTNLLISGFIRFMETGGQLFVLTSTMGNVNRPENLTHLRDTVPGIRVKVYPPPHIPFDQAPPGFHPKAYLFQHRDGRGALLIGSSNSPKPVFSKTWSGTTFPQTRSISRLTATVPLMWSWRNSCATGTRNPLPLQTISSLPTGPDGSPRIWGGGTSSNPRPLNGPRLRSGPTRPRSRPWKTCAECATMG